MRAAKTRKRKPKNHPLVIQGGLGAGVSLCLLAQAVSLSNSRALGVISGVALLEIFTKILQLGDRGGYYRRAMEHFDGDQSIIARILEKYFNKIGANGEFVPTPSPKVKMDGVKEKKVLTRDEIECVAAFCEVWLARHDIDGNLIIGPDGKPLRIGFNILTKVERDILALVDGARRAGVHVIIMGAGIPNQMPKILDALCNNQPVEYRLSVEGAKKDDHFIVRYDPNEMGVSKCFHPRPLFYAIVSSLTLAIWMQDAGADGLIVESPEAGGHNANPRRGDEYGKKDEIDWVEFRRKVGIPYVIAGALASKPNRWEIMKKLGASGIQFGSIYSLADESGFLPELKAKVINAGVNGTLKIRTTKRSPSGYRWKVAVIRGTLSSQSRYKARRRRCNKFCLQSAYRIDKDNVGWRCSAGPVKAFEIAGGDPKECEDMYCLCNGLLAAIGLGDPGEPPIVTQGDDSVSFIPMITKYVRRRHYSAKEATNFLLQGIEALVY